MKLRTLAVCLLFAGVCSAREHDYQKGTLLRMDSSSCGTQEKGSKTVAGEIFGTDGQHKQTQEMLCQEYVLQSERVIYREFFPIGLTAFDSMETSLLGVKPTISHVVARQEVRRLIASVNLLSAHEERQPWNIVRQTHQRPAAPAGHLTLAS